MTTKKMLKDPVCGAEMKPKNVEQRSEYGGNSYYFCSAACKAQFDSQPDKYARPRAA